MNFRLSEKIFKCHFSIIIFALLMLSNKSQAQEYKSSPNKVHFIELFSTQSCSSCPPAQDWISKLKTNSHLWKTFIPIVYHVDYWNYLGWKDPYSSSQYSQRQRDYVAEWFSSTAYTPMFVYDGKEARKELLSNYNKPGRPVGVLIAKKGNRGEYDIIFEPIAKYQTPLVINYAILGSSIKTKITAGENNGVTLKHDFLSLKMNSKNMKVIGNKYVSKIKIDLKKIQPAPEKAIVFWVSLINSKMPIQSVGGIL